MPPLRTALAVLLAAAPLAAQAPAPSPSRPPVTFAVEVAYVEVDAIVTDESGQPLRDLRPDEFVVLEDGKPQAIELFTRVDIPYDRPEPEAPPPVPPDVARNAEPFEGRLYVIVLDELHTAPQRSLLVRAAARRFLQRHFAEGDLAAVVHTSGPTSASQELTGNRQLLLEAVDRFLGRKLPSRTLGRIDEYRRTQGIRQRGDPVRDPEEMQRAYNARTSLDVLKGVSEWLAGIRGRRKAILFLSEGIDYPIYDAISNQQATTVLDAMRQATAAATRANVSFYTVDPRGLGGLADETMEIQPVFDDDPALGLNTQGLDSDLRTAQDSLRVLADETSGLAAVNTNDFSTAFARMVRDNSAYYVLGYYPSGPRREGRFHKLEVKVTRPGAKVRARSGYSTPRGRTAPRPGTGPNRETPLVLAELLESPLPRPGLPLAVQAAAFQGSGGTARVMVAIQVAPQAFRLREKDGTFHDALDLSIVAVGGTGRATGANQKVPLALKPQTRQVVEAAGLRIVSWLDLKPGRYQVRVAGRSANAGETGSVFYDLAVPEFGKQPLALSHLVVTSTSAGGVATVGALDAFKEVLPGPPTLARGFRHNDTIAVMAEVYDSEKQPHTLDLVTTLTAPDGSVAFRSADERSGEALSRAGGGAIVHTAQIPLRDVPPGTYTLRVSAASRLGRNPPKAERAVTIQVVPPPEG